MVNILLINYKVLFGMVNMLLIMNQLLLIITGWWLSHHSEKYESQIGSSSQLLGNIKHAPNHQPVLITKYSNVTQYRWYLVIYPRWCPQSIAKLVNKHNSNFTMVFVGVIFIVFMGFINQSTSRLGGTTL